MLKNNSLGRDPGRMARAVPSGDVVSVVALVRGRWFLSADHAESPGDRRRGRTLGASSTVARSSKGRPASTRRPKGPVPGRFAQGITEWCQTGHLRECSPCVVRELLEIRFRDRHGADLLWRGVAGVNRSRACSSSCSIWNWRRATPAASGTRRASRCAPVHTLAHRPSRGARCALVLPLLKGGAQGVTVFRRRPGRPPATRCECPRTSAGGCGRPTLCRNFVADVLLQVCSEHGERAHILWAVRHPHPGRRWQPAMSRCAPWGNSVVECLVAHPSRRACAWPVPPRRRRRTPAAVMSRGWSSPDGAIRNATRLGSTRSGSRVKSFHRSVSTLGTCSSPFARRLTMPRLLTTSSPIGCPAPQWRRARARTESPCPPGVSPRPLSSRPCRSTRSCALPDGFTLSL